MQLNIPAPMLFKIGVQESRVLKYALLVLPSILTQQNLPSFAPSWPRGPGWLASQSQAMAAAAAAGGKWMPRCCSTPAARGILRATPRNSHGSGKSENPPFVKEQGLHWSSIFHVSSREITCNIIIVSTHTHTQRHTVRSLFVDQEVDSAS